MKVLGQGGGGVGGCGTSNYHHEEPPPPFQASHIRGIAAALRKEGSSTSQGPEVLTVLHFYHLGEHSLAFLMELFNLSCWSSHPGNFEELRHYPNFEGREAPWANSFYCHILLLCPAVKIFKQLLFLTIMEALSTRRYEARWLGRLFSLRHPTRCSGLSPYQWT